MVSEPVVCLNDEPAEDDKIGEFEEYGWVETPIGKFQLDF